MEKFQAYTLLNTVLDQILMQIENWNLLTPPEPMKGDPSKRNRNKHYHFYNNYGHLTIEYILLKKKIEALILRGEWTEFVDKIIADNGRGQLTTQAGKNRQVVSVAQ